MFNDLDASEYIETHRNVSGRIRTQQEDFVKNKLKNSEEKSEEYTDTE